MSRFPKINFFLAPLINPIRFFDSVVKSACIIYVWCRIYVSDLTDVLDDNIVNVLDDIGCRFYFSLVENFVGGWTKYAVF